jgi:hypothetical protein
MQSLAAGGRSMVVSVKSRNATAPIPYSAVTAGQYDQTFLNGFAQLSALPTPTFFIYQHEADSTSAKAACSQPTDSVCGPEFVAAWKHVYNLAESHGFQNLIFAWTITSYGFNPQTGVRNNYYWPGEAYTDWLGVDAYNGGCEGSWWGSFEQSVESSVSWAKVHAPTKPIIIPELGATEGATATAKADFFNGIPATLAKPGYNNIKAILHWNNQENGCNFKVDSTATSFAAYRQTGLNPTLSARGSDADKMISTTPPVDPSPDPSTSPSPDPSTSPSPDPSTSPSPDPSTSPSPSPDPSTSPSPDPSTSPAPDPSTSPAPDPSTSPTPGPTGTPTPPSAPAPSVRALAGTYTIAPKVSVLHDLRATIRMNMKAGETRVMSGKLRVGKATATTAVTTIVACRTSGATHSLANALARATTKQNVRAGRAVDSFWARLEFTAPANGTYDCALDAIFSSGAGGRITVLTDSSLGDATGPLQANAQTFQTVGRVVQSKVDTALIAKYTVPAAVSVFDVIGDVSVTNCYRAGGTCPTVTTTTSSKVASELVVYQLQSDGTLCHQMTGPLAKAAVDTTTRTLKIYNRLSIQVDPQCTSRDFKAYIRTYRQNGNIFEIQSDTQTNNFIFDS